jgi:hypothetical protein
VPGPSPGLGAGPAHRAAGLGLDGRLGHEYVIPARTTAIRRSARTACTTAMRRGRRHRHQPRGARRPRRPAGVVAVEPGHLTHVSTSLREATNPSTRTFQMRQRASFRTCGGLEGGGGLRPAVSRAAQYRWSQVTSGARSRPVPRSAPGAAPDRDHAAGRGLPQRPHGGRDRADVGRDPHLATPGRGGHGPGRPPAPVGCHGQAALGRGEAPSGPGHGLLGPARSNGRSRHAARSRVPRGTVLRAPSGAHAP